MKIAMNDPERRTAFQQESEEPNKAMLCSIVELWHEEGSPIFRVKTPQQLLDPERAS